MATCQKPVNHQHQHGTHCGHNKIRHDDHYDYIHDGHMHHVSENGECQEHLIEVSSQNPNRCQPLMHCMNHRHDKNCGHEAVPHGDHICYIVDGRLHHWHNGHCDDHGSVEIIRNAKIAEQTIPLGALSKRNPIDHSQQRDEPS